MWDRGWRKEVGESPRALEPENGKFESVSEPRHSVMGTGQTRVHLALQEPCSKEIPWNAGGGETGVIRNSLWTLARR